MTRADLLVVIAAIAMLPFLYLKFWSTAPADQAQVLVGAKTALTIPLSEDRSYTVQGSMGPSVITVENGRIRFSDSPCQGKQCIHSGWLRHGGEFAACLPNRVSVLIAGTVNEFDAINF